MPSELIGYADEFSVAPGEQIRFMVSTDLPTYEAAIVRLIHADENPNGPGFKEEVIDADRKNKRRSHVVRQGIWAQFRA